MREIKFENFLLKKGIFFLHFFNNLQLFVFFQRVYLYIINNKYFYMKRYPLTDIKYISPFDQFLRQALSDITGEEILINSVIGNNDLLSCLSHKLARDTGLDSCDIAAWLSQSLKQYWAECGPAGNRFF
jgi:hypothetical protein